MPGLASPGMSIPNTGPSSASAAGMREVAAEAGVSLRLVQYYFGTKEELLLSGMQHLAAQFGERALTRIKRIKETGGQSSAEQAQAVIDYHLDRLFPASRPALRDPDRPHQGHHAMHGRKVPYGAS